MYGAFTQATKVQGDSIFFFNLFNFVHFFDFELFFIVRILFVICDCHR